MLGWCDALADDVVWDNCWDGRVGAYVAMMFKITWVAVFRIRDHMQHML